MLDEAHKALEAMSAACSAMKVEEWGEAACGAGVVMAGVRKPSQAERLSLCRCRHAYRQDGIDMTVFCFAERIRPIPSALRW
jgi:hypothetical protein